MDFLDTELIGYTCLFLGIVAVFWMMVRLYREQQVMVESNSLRPPDAFGSLTKPLALSIPIGPEKLKQLERELVGAGHYNSNALHNFLSRRNACVMLCLLSIAAVLALEVLAGKEVFVIAFGLSIAVFIYGVPRLLLSAKSKHRCRKIEYALPDALDMVSMSIEGGVPMQRALKLVAEEFSETHRPLSQELKIIARQTETGSLGTAMTQFAGRLDLPEIVAWSAMLQQSQRLGVQVVDSMKDYSDRIRDSRQKRAEQAGQTATVKLLLPVVLCLAPPIFVLLIGPAVLDFKDFINRDKQPPSELIQMANEPSVTSPGGVR